MQYSHLISPISSHYGLTDEILNKYDIHYQYGQIRLQRYVYSDSIQILIVNLQFPLIYRVTRWSTELIYFLDHQSIENLVDIFQF